MTASARSFALCTLVLLAGSAGLCGVTAGAGTGGLPAVATSAGDPPSLEDCVLVAVDTPTPAQPHVYVCRPF